MEEEDDDRAAEPAAAMIEHLAQRLVDRYGSDAPEEADHIVRLLTEDGNAAQAGVWTKVQEACRNLLAKPPRELSRKR
jgi:hypothetical protein